MQTTFAAFLMVVALLPGASAWWVFQRSALRHGNRLSDLLPRLFATSALCWAVGAWPLYWLYSNYWGTFVAGGPLPLWLIFVPIAYLGVPCVVGWSFGKIVRVKDWRICRLAGEDRGALAWDHLLNRGQHGFIICRLKQSGRWVGGYYGEGSYASESTKNQDLYINKAFKLHEDSGQPVMVNGEYIFTGGGVLVKWYDVETLEFIPISHELICEKKKPKEIIPRERHPTGHIHPKDLSKVVFNQSATIATCGTDEDNNSNSSRKRGINWWPWVCKRCNAS